MAKPMGEVRTAFSLDNDNLAMIRRQAGLDRNASPYPGPTPSSSPSALPPPPAYGSYGGGTLSEIASRRYGEPEAYDQAFRQPMGSQSFDEPRLRRVGPPPRLFTSRDLAIALVTGGLAAVIVLAQRPNYIKREGTDDVSVGRVAATASIVAGLAGAGSIVTRLWSSYSDR